MAYEIKTSFGSDPKSAGGYFLRYTDDTLEPKLKCNEKPNELTREFLAFVQQHIPDTRLESYGHPEDYRIASVFGIVVEKKDLGVSILLYHLYQTFDFDIEADDVTDEPKNIVARLTISPSLSRDIPLLEQFVASKQRIRRKKRVTTKIKEENEK